MKRYTTIKFILFAFAALAVSCEKEYLYEEPAPDVSTQTTSLEAVFVATPPSSLNASYWKKADYLKVNLTDVSKQHTFGDGYLNMTGIYSGLSAFNNGVDPQLTLKAAYDNENIYLLAEWNDAKVNCSNGSYLYNGPADPLKLESPTGWTAQRNSDKLSFAFDISAASSSAGTFSNVGCAASCHATGSTHVMQPSSGKVDIWNWSLATSNPLGYMHDMVSGQDSFYHDAGQKCAERNGLSGRSGPQFEWSGASQSISTSSGQTAVLDPGFYLYNKTAFAGNIARGDSLYHRLTPPGDCASCHGEKGEGASAAAINNISMNKKSRASLIAGMDNVSDMVTYWGPLSAADREDILAFLRGLSGVPGYYLMNPSGSSADIKVISNVTPVQIANALLPATNQHSKYQVLITRKLNTTNADDAQFTPTTQRTVKFGVALMDNDGMNHIGSMSETLIFK